MTCDLEKWKAGVISLDELTLARCDFNFGTFDVPYEERVRKIEYMIFRTDQLLQRPWEL